MRVLPGALAALLICVGFVAGCSSSGNGRATSSPAPRSSAVVPRLDRAAYKQVLAQISHEEDRAQAAIQRALHAKGAAVLRQGLAAFAADQTRVAARLSAVTAPPDAQQANAALARAFAANARAVRAVAAQLAGVKTMPAALRLLNSAKAPQHAGQAIDAALGRLQRLGYTHAS
jgi:hypothetical protein